MYADECCPKCDAENLIYCGDPCDSSGVDPETFRCWNCKTVIRMPEYAEDPCVVADDQDHADEEGRRLAD